MTHCAWCGRFTRADAKPLRFVNVLGEPVKKGPLCPECTTSCCDLAGRNVSRAPNLNFLSSLRSGRSGVTR